MVVSTEAPSAIAVMLAPLPRCAMISRGGTSLPELVQDRFTGESVKTVAADTRVPKSFRKRKARRGFRKSAMERRIEAGELRDARELLLRLANHAHRNRHVQRRKRSGGFQFSQHVWSNLLVLAQLGSAVDDAVADGCRHRKWQAAQRLGDGAQRFFLVA